MDVSYKPPVNRLLAMGETDLWRREWAADYRAIGLTEADIPDLIRMVRDDALHDAPLDSPRTWAPMHAWRALGQLQSEAAVHPLLELFVERWEDDFVFEDIPETLGMIGGAALEPAAELLRTVDHDPYLRVAAARAIREVGVRHPGCREAAVLILTRQMEQWEEQDGDLNAFLVSYLADLGAEDAAPMVREAFEAGAVSTGICGDWNAIGPEFGVWNGLRAPMFVPPKPAARERLAERKPGDGARAAAKRKAQKRASRKRR